MKQITAVIPHRLEALQRARQVVSHLPGRSMERIRTGERGDAAA